MPAACFFRSFPLDGKSKIRRSQRNQRIKTDIKGLPHLATAPPPCRPGPRAQPGRSLAFPSTVSVVFTFVLNDTIPPLVVIANPHSANAERDLQRSWDALLVVALRHREASFREHGRGDPFMTDLCKFASKTIHFIPSNLPDSKRLQSTTNVYSTAWS